MQRWIYHISEEPRLINDEDLAKYVKSGWAESPADVAIILTSKALPKKKDKQNDSQ